MSGIQQRVVVAHGVPMSALLAEPDPGRGQPLAVIVALHGGGTSAVYFDCPGQPQLSLLRSGAAAGYTVIALDRPGYGSSAPYPEAMTEPAQRVELAYAAVDRILGDRPRGAGLFVMGHSAGCELALRMAAGGIRPDLLGLELAGTGRRYHPAAHDVLRTARPDHRPEGLRELLWEPARLYPPGVADRIATGTAGPPYETATVIDWAYEALPALAAGIRVPVQFSFAEHERIWQSDPGARTEIAGLFTAAPHVVVNAQPDAGHNLSLGVNAAAYHRSVFSFVERCAVRDVIADREVV